MTPPWRTLCLALLSPRREAGRQPEALLPLEVWDLVFQALLNDDHMLLQVACVCRIFNELAIALFFRRNKINLSTGAVTVNPYTVTALYLSCGHLPINTLSCSFFSTYVRSMRILRAVVEKCPDLTNLHLTYATLGTRRISGEKTFLLALCDVLHAMSKRMAGPVIVLGTNFILRFEVADLCTRKRYNWIPARIQRVLKVDSPSQFSMQLKARQLAYPAEVEIQCIRAELGPFNSFTLIAFDMMSLTLVPTKTLSAADISSILSHIRVPLLRYFHLHTDAINPAVLSQFFSRHTGVLRIHISHTDGSRHPLCTPPVLLPILSEISSCDAARIPALLDAFGHSPQLYAIRINFDRTTVPLVAELKTALRRISLQPHITRLELNLPRNIGVALQAYPPDDEEHAILSTVHFVRDIRLLAHSIADARAVIPRLAMLPALRTLNLDVDWTGTKRPDLPALIEEARTALPSSTHVWSSWQ
ncbi:hypothetical protein GGX14DRAFT_580194 [Mycena pura]|uniref:F-box domain-containing protein n=1 Tax=Mycena pura TaxID=153505 RepID=A0AAD6XXV3_9AGAR|nr:hypothetical protein GGX14DRAFT_580194 [Mycena pura]